MMTMNTPPAPASPKVDLTSVSLDTLAQFVKDPDAFQRVLDGLQQRQAQAEATEKQANAAVIEAAKASKLAKEVSDEADRKRALTESDAQAHAEHVADDTKRLASRKDELEAREHKLLERVKDEEGRLKEAEALLNQRADALTQSEAEIVGRVQEVEKREAALKKREDTVAFQEKDLARRKAEMAKFAAAG